LLAHPETSIVFADSVYTSADGTPLERTRPVPPFDYRKFVAKCENPISQPSSFIRKEVIEKTGLLDSKYYYFMDWDFWLRAGLNFKIDHVDEVWSTYRLHADSKTVSQAIKAAPELEYMYNKFFSRQDLPAAISKLRRKAMMNMYFTKGGYYLKGGDRKMAARMGKKAFSRNFGGIISFINLRKFFYCTMGGSGFYNSLRKLLGRTQ